MACEVKRSPTIASDLEKFVWLGRPVSRNANTTTPQYIVCHFCGRPFHIDIVRCAPPSPRRPPPPPHRTARAQTPNAPHCTALHCTAPAHSLCHVRPSPVHAMPRHARHASHATHAMCARVRARKHTRTHMRTRTLLHVRTRAHTRVPACTPARPHTSMHSCITVRAYASVYLCKTSTRNEFLHACMRACGI